jgi:predicted DNA-binding transcriptional regulator AlpA
MGRKSAEVPLPEAILWGWPEILKATGIPRRSLERAMKNGQFPQPTRKVRRRPFWLAATVRAWANGQT